MRRVKSYCRLAGWLLVCLGVMFMPLGYGINPKRDLSLFHNLADLPAFLMWAVGFVGVGVATIGVAYSIPGEFSE